MPWNLACQCISMRSALLFNFPLMRFSATPGKDSAVDKDYQSKYAAPGGKPDKKANGSSSSSSSSSGFSSSGTSSSSSGSSDSSDTEEEMIEEWLAQRKKHDDEVRLRV